MNKELGKPILERGDNAAKLARNAPTRTLTAQDLRNYDPKTRSMRHDVGLYRECSECAPQDTQGLRNRMGKIATKLAGTALALTFVFSTPGTLPTGCAQTGHTGEDFPEAYCRDGSVWYQDMDGQVYANNAGNPVYEPGTWVKINQSS